MSEAKESEPQTSNTPNEPSPVNPTPAGRGLVRLKLLLSLLVGLATAAAGCVAGLYSLHQPHSWVCLPQRDTVWPQMWCMAKYLNEYKEKHGAFPLTLDEAKDKWTFEGKPLNNSELERRIQDGWKKPMIYSSDGRMWELLSYGADGKPGGVGLDADIRSTDVDNPGFSSHLYKNAMPTVEQIVSSPHFRSTAVFSALAGIVGFVFAVSNLFALKNCVATRLEVIIAGIGITVATSFIVIVHITVQSVASGH